MPRTLLARLGRERELEAIAARRRHDAELAAVELDDLVADGEPEAAAARAALPAATAVGLEDPLAIRGRDRLALALDAELPDAGHPDRVDRDRAAVPRPVLERVREQVHEHLADQPFLGREPRQRPDLDGGAVTADLGREHRDAVGDERPQGDRPPLQWGLLER